MICARCLKLIVHRFTANIVLRSISIAGPDDDQHPRIVKAFTNRNDVDFDLAERLPPVALWDLHPDPTGVCEYPARYTAIDYVDYDFF